jgi:FTR1 family protein
MSSEASFGFSLPIFVALFREATEAAIVVAVLLAFINNSFKDQPVVKKALSRSVWLGTFAGLFVSLVIGAAFMIIWYKFSSNLW